MIPHHQMAISMSQIVLRNSSNPAVQGLAQRIIRAQGPEIAAMQSWLYSGFGIRNFRPRMTAADVQMLHDLQGLHGTAFDKAYLTDMVEHHQMAITGDGTMPGAEDVLARGFHPRLLKLAGNIVRTQTAEIQEMRALLGQGTAGMTAMPNM